MIMTCINLCKIKRNQYSLDPFETCSQRQSHKSKCIFQMLNMKKGRFINHFFIFEDLSYLFSLNNDAW